MPPIISMKESTKKLLNVTKVHKTFDGGQKYVFIATCGDVKCAIKMFKYGFGRREERELEFYKENAALNGIPKILDVINEKNETIVVEEYIKGNCLQDIISDYRESSSLISKLVCDIADIMEPIWNEGKTHRDLKPLNIIITPEGLPVVLDFGIFKDPSLTTITDTGVQPNTWMFAAPEQLLGNKRHISYRTDFFSLGVMAYCLYYQTLPFGDNRDDVIARMVEQDLTYPTVENCSLNVFFEQTLNFDVSVRPRNVTLLKESFVS
ncbi:MAG: protein kinase [Desulfobacter sp.]|nr:MAG: protein kinase [Desulfobacter sp.]